MYLEKNKVFYDNIFVISNEFIWDKNGYFIDYKEPVIHTFNKDETVLKEFPEIFEKIQNRKNVILL
jgi:5'-nucleotidase